MQPEFFSEKGATRPAVSEGTFCSRFLLPQRLKNLAFVAKSSKKAILSENAFMGATCK
ncbi:hypothetical protein ACE1YR_13330 [Pseudomonas sp. K1(2024)]|uniref:Uncharacterized protein n=1 Tax=Pseudomonas boreofloridensis TaxID=3064348 RepID=A0ABV4ZAM3_9PSED|nr:hypothetical protein [Pseudomonas sp. K13]MDO7902732.1 hypothetical protein [Pseudomonas sp. K13]